MRSPGGWLPTPLPLPWLTGSYHTRRGPKDEKNPEYQYAGVVFGLDRIAALCYH
jgi:hypothetical protein